MVLASGDDGHLQVDLVQAPAPPVGDHPVLVHVHAVALQQGELEILDALRADPAKERDRAGQGVCSDAAGTLIELTHAFDSYESALQDLAAGRLRG